MTQLVFFSSINTTTKLQYLFTMKIKLSRLRKIIREELLREGQQGSASNLAVHVMKRGSMIKVAFYDPAIFLDSISKNKNMEKPAGDADDIGSMMAADPRVEKAAQESIKGYLNMDTSTGKWGPCAGAAEIKGTWGPGFGDVIYGTAFALAPNGIVMPDRKSVSPSAEKSWERRGKNIPSVTLDDRTHKACKNSNTHTEDTNDDCEVHYANDSSNSKNTAIDKAYNGENQKADLTGMQQRHKKLINDVKDTIPGVTPQEIEMRLISVAVERFGEAMLSLL